MPIDSVNNSASNKNLLEKPRAILLDMDDTIIVDDPVSEKSWRTVCRRFAPRIGIDDPDALYAAIKASSRDFWRDYNNHRQGRLDLRSARRDVVVRAFAGLGLKADSTAVELADAFSVEKDRAIAPLPGALETLQLFKERGLPLALITNGASDIQREKIRRFDLARFFDTILIEGEFGVGKPDERVFRAALDRLNVPASHAWMVGDDLDRDIAGAKNAGVRSIWVDWRGRGLPEKSAVRPDCIIGSLSQLSEVFLD